MAYFLGFRGDSSISLSQAVRDRTGQAAFLRSARAGPSAQVGWRQVKVSSTFSKGRYVPVGRCPAADRGGSREAGVRGVLVPGGHRSGPTEAAAETRSPCLPILPKKGERTSPSWGATETGVLACGRGGHGATATAPAATAFGVCAACAASFPPAAPVKAVELCSTPRKFFEKNLTKNFYLSLLFPSAGFWASVSQPAPAPLSAVRVMSRAATR